MLIDTHCHLDLGEFDGDRDRVIERAQQQGLRALIVPAIDCSNLATVRQLAHSFPQGRYALGLHPICMPTATQSDLVKLDTAIRDAMDDARMVAIGEIGLDYFIPELKQSPLREKQEAFYVAQLDLAERYGLPLLIHVRRSHDILLKHLRRRKHIGGIAHAFNGSFQQAEQFIELGFALGFGGAMTFTRALQIRRLARQLPLEHLVLETDAPDIPPAWLGKPPSPKTEASSLRRDAKPRNEPAELTRIAECLAELRGCTFDEIIAATCANAQRVLPRLAF